MTDSREQAVIAYGIHLLAAATGGEPQALYASLGGELSNLEDAWPRYAAVLATQPQAPEKALTPIFTHVRLKPLAPAPDGGQWYYPPAPLALTAETLMPVAGQPATQSREKSWTDFGREFRLALALEPEGLFERFHHLMYRHGWAIPCSYGEPGVSLFDQWKTVASLIFASPESWQAGPGDVFTLIGGDIPGIQDFVYTITSKGAAKGLRGRSFFVQLLGDAVIRRILVELKLSPANVIYNAGGNFMVLGPSEQTKVDGETVQVHLQRLRADIEEALLAGFKGELTTCVAWTRLERSQVGSNEFATVASRDLKQRIADAKRQRFASTSRRNWSDLFGAQGKAGNRYCVICQEPLARGEGVPMEGSDVDPATGEPRRRCQQCDGFKLLAEKIGRDWDLMAVGRERPAQGGEPWQEALWMVGHVWYDFGRQSDLYLPLSNRLYTLNRTDFLASSAHGFRFIANITPRVTDDDVRRWGARKRETDDSDERPVAGSIRTFSQMADVARGVPRVGILRMDVDNLGQIMVRGLASRTLAATSALSRMMDIFFAGWLNRICEEVNRAGRTSETDEGRGDCLYVIYAGGDDLFVVGAWDLMPVLAGRVHEDFKQYSCQNPDFSISAGITVEDRKFPLYQAAERAGEAEETAKSHRRNGVRKDAISFLGLAVKWDEWPAVTARAQTIADLVSSEQAPKALIQVLESIHAQYDEQIPVELERQRHKGQPAPEEPSSEVYYGPWMWRQAYALTRLAKRVAARNKEAADKVKELQVNTLLPAPIRQSGLAARWAELLTRKERES